MLSINFCYFIVVIPKLTSLPLPVFCHSLLLLVLFWNFFFLASFLRCPFFFVCVFTFYSSYSSTPFFIFYFAIFSFIFLFDFTFSPSSSFSCSYDWARFNIFFIFFVYVSHFSFFPLLITSFIFYSTVFFFTFLYLYYLASYSSKVLLSLVPTIVQTVTSSLSSHFFILRLYLSFFIF